MRDHPTNVREAFRACKKHCLTLPCVSRHFNKLLSEQLSQPIDKHKRSHASCVTNVAKKFTEFVENSSTAMPDNIKIGIFQKLLVPHKETHGVLLDKQEGKRKHDAPRATITVVTYD